MAFDRSTKALRRRVHFMTLCVTLLVLLSLGAMAQMFLQAQRAQTEIALAMRQVSEVTWRIKNIEMWSHLYESEAKRALLTRDATPLARPAAFLISDARALDGLAYLDDVLEHNTSHSLSQMLTTLERVSNPAEITPETLIASLSAIDPYRAELVREAGNLNFEHIATLLTTTREGLLISFWSVGAASLLTILLAAFLWTSERRLAAKIRENGRNQLETLGAMTSGFAHVTQNILWCLRASLDDLGKLSGLTEADRPKLARARRDVQSLTDMNIALTQAAHDPTQNDRLVTLGQVIDEIEDRFADAPIQPQIEIDSASLLAQVPLSTFTFVLTELVQNALDAAQEETPLTVELSARLARDTLTLTVKDTGRGMSDTVLANATSPFFSTKENENGHCGLGLHSIARLIANLGGTLDIASAESQGTQVTLTLPVPRP